MMNARLVLAHALILMLAQVCSPTLWPQPDPREESLRQSFFRFGEAWASGDRRGLAKVMVSEQGGPSRNRLASEMLREMPVQEAPSLVHLQIEGGVARIEAHVVWKEGGSEPAKRETGEFFFWMLQGEQWLCSALPLWNPNPAERGEYASFLDRASATVCTPTGSEAVTRATKSFLEAAERGESRAMEPWISRHLYFSSASTSWDRDSFAEGFCMRALSGLLAGPGRYELLSSPRFDASRPKDPDAARPADSSAENDPENWGRPALYSIRVRKTLSDGTTQILSLQWVEEEGAMRLWGIR